MKYTKQFLLFLSLAAFANGTGLRTMGYYDDDSDTSSSDSEVGLKSLCMYEYTEEGCATILLKKEPKNACLWCVAWDDPRDTFCTYNNYTNKVHYNCQPPMNTEEQKKKEEEEKKEREEREEKEKKEKEEEEAKKDSKRIKREKAEDEKDFMDKKSQDSCFPCYERCVATSNNPHTYEGRLKCKAKCECITQQEAFKRMTIDDSATETKELPKKKGVYVFKKK